MLNEMLPEGYDVLRFYSFREAHSPAVLDDGSLVFVSDISGKPELWLLPKGECFPVQLTFLGGYVSSPRAFGGGVAFQFDPNGSEEHRLLWADTQGSVKVLREGGPGVVHRIGGAWGGVLSYASNKRSKPFFDTYVLVDGKERPVFIWDGTSQPHELSPDGRLLLVTVATTNLNNDLYLVDLEGGGPRKLLEHTDEALTVEPKWGPDGFIYACTNLGDEYLQPVKIDPKSGRVFWLSRSKWDAEHIAVSDQGLVAYTRNVEGYSELHVLDAALTEIYSRLYEGTVSELAFSGKTLYYTFSGWDTNTNIFALELLSRTERRVTNASRGYLGPVVKPELARYSSFDGLSVPVFVYTPEKHGHRPPYPVVVYVHGGPESQKRLDYDGQIQFLLHEGYAVLTPNVRGSTGYGKTYTHLDDVRRRLDSVRDLVSLAEWIRADPRFDPQRICLMGRSYGGYMVLAALAFYPELWRCGVEAVGIANLETFLRNTAVWRRALREAEYGSLERDLDFLREASPINHVDRIRAPLLIQHGANDPRVPLSESRAIVEAIRARGGFAELVVFEDEGHMIQSIENRLKWAVKVREFLKKHL